MAGQKLNGDRMLKLLLWALPRNVFIQLLHLVFHHCVLHYWLLGGIHWLTVAMLSEFRLLRTAYFKVFRDDIYKEDVSR